MHGDFSRVTFDPAQRFSAVLSQQGRVQLDAEFNEQTAILLHYVRTLAADVLGPAAYPPDDDPDGIGGFGVEGCDGETFTVAPGRMYVDGILCECDGTDYWEQPDGHLDPSRDDDRLPSGPFLIYLRVWERLVTALEAPWIREVALGTDSPDTTARTRVVWQLCPLPMEGGSAPDAHDAARYVRKRIRRRFEPRGALAARTRRPEETTTLAPGALPASSGYRAPENQLYRVEIHRGGTEGTATFKWSRENGSVVLPIRDIQGPTVLLDSLGRDDKLGVDTGDVVEIVDDATVSRGAADYPDEGCCRLYTVQEIDYGGHEVRLDAEPEHDPYLRTAGQSARHHPLLRRWDHGTNAWGDEQGEGLPVREAEWLPLEDGVEIWFEPGEDRSRVYRHGDHWLIPARVLTGDVEWPRGRGGRPLPRRPHGVHYHYAPLAYVEPRGDGDFRLVDLRVPIHGRR
ncbi:MULTISPECIES: DUF6519 domain-containing protein [unclassified Streptomyces]|uniref:DUF6519 domain-containing protein n=1 Tax=unclassified Streptomyces TaxID=2593676 RepID=UPI00093E0EDB|nr:DUF6519 domain-containing protein [Streptomyces sp. TSRI0107]OKJ77387.1 hypothetical protein AMK31_28615 [Streptomyces sp. TSRI0107]